MTPHRSQPGGRIESRDPMAQLIPRGRQVRAHGQERAAGGGTRCTTGGSCVRLIALVLVIAAGSMQGCGKLGSQRAATECAGGKCDGQSAFARSVVRRGQPLALSNVQQERLTWRIWGSTFALDDTVRARISLTPSGTS